MGVGPFSGRRCSSSPYAVPNSNPNPNNFKILQESYSNGYLILWVEYPNCTNFEGKKILVYKNFDSSKTLLFFNRGELDPHFSKSGGSPIARFKPCNDSLELIQKMIS